VLKGIDDGIVDHQKCSVRLISRRALGKPQRAKLFWVAKLTISTIDE